MTIASSFQDKALAKFLSIGAVGVAVGATLRSLSSGLTACQSYLQRKTGKSAHAGPAIAARDIRHVDIQTEPYVRDHESLRTARRSENTAAVDGPGRTERPTPVANELHPKTSGTSEKNHLVQQLSPKSLSGMCFTCLALLFR